MNEISEIDSFSSFQRDLQNFLQNYLDNYQKEKFFKLNVKSFLRRCVENALWQNINEKVEECVKKEEKKKEMLTFEMKSVYYNNLKILEDCCDKCKSKEDLKCLLGCGGVFKENYDRDMSKIIESNFNKLI